MTFPSGYVGSREAVVGRLRQAGCVFAEDEAELLLDAARDASHLDQMVRQRELGEPLEYIVGWAEFCGLRVAVRSGIFVPRHRSQLLVEAAVELARPGALVLDICCGSGALGMAVASSIADVELHATDSSAVAVICARQNLALLDAVVYQGDLYDALPVSLLGRFDLILANAPYVPSDDIRTLPREARLYEPPESLDGGADGLEVQRRIAETAKSWLASEGHLLIETSTSQISGTKRRLIDGGLDPAVIADDDLDATVVMGSISSDYQPV